MISQWLVNWGDGQGQQTYNAASPGDSVTRSSSDYSQTTAQATVQVTALDGNGHSISATQTIYLAPNAVSISGSVAAGGNSADITWSGTTSIASEYIIQRLDPGSTTWETIGYQPAIADGTQQSYSFTDSSVSPSLIGGDSGYLYRVAAKTSDATSDDPGSPGVSAYSPATSLGGNPDVISGELHDGEANINGESPVSITSSQTGYAFPSGSTDTITISNLPPHMAFNLTLQGGVSYPNPYAEYPNPEDLITLNGPDGQSITQSGENSGLNDGIATGLTYADGNSMTSATFTVTGYVPDEGGTWYVQPIVTTYLGNPGFGNGEPAIDVGGETDVPVTFSCVGYENVSEVTLNVVNYDPEIIHPTEQQVTLYNDGDSEDFHGVLPVDGVAVGQSDLVLADAIDDQAKATVTTRAPEVSAAVQSPGGIPSQSENEGGTYNTEPDNAAGFTFTLPVPSVTPVTVHFNTSGSTLPSSVLSQLGTSVTVPVGSTSTFLPFAMADDGKVAPDRYAVVNLDVAGDAQTPPPQAKLKVVNSDKPTVKINGATDNAVIKLDPQNDDSQLTVITLDAGQVDGTIESTSLTWSAADFLMWCYPHNRAPGTDLASLPTAGLGMIITQSGGMITATFLGSVYPDKLYGQCLNGSATWDTTEADFSVDIDKAATAEVPAQTRVAENAAKGTAQGLVIEGATGLGAYPLTVIVSQRELLHAVWEGPGTVASDGVVTWSFTGQVATSFDVTATSGHAKIMATSSEPYAENSVSFFWFDGAFNGWNKYVTANLTSSTISGVEKQQFIVTTPHIDLKVTTAPSASLIISGGLGDQSVTTYGIDTGTHGIEFDAKGSMPPGFAGGALQWVQTLDRTDWYVDGTHLHDYHLAGLDTHYPYPPNAEVTPTYDASASDSPSRSSVGTTTGKIYGTDGHYVMHLMFRSTIPGSDWVPIALVDWDLQFISAKKLQLGGILPSWGILDSSVPKNVMADYSPIYPDWDAVWSQTHPYN